MPGVEIRKDPKNEIRREPVNDLMLFKAGMSLRERAPAIKNEPPQTVVEEGEFSGA